MYKSIGMISSEVSQAPKREPHSPSAAVCFVEPYCSAPVSCNQSVVVGRADAARYRPLPLNDFIHVTACMYIFTWSISNFIYAYIYNVYSCFWSCGHMTIHEPMTSYRICRRLLTDRNISTTELHFDAMAELETVEQIAKRFKQDPLCEWS